MSFQILEDEGVLCHQDEIDRLERHARHRLGGRVQAFRLLIHRCGLVLRGNTLTFHAKQLAQHAIMEETRIPILANEIEVGHYSYDSGFDSERP